MFVFEQAVTALPTALEVSPKHGLAFPFANVFKKQRFRCNRTFMQCELSNNAKTNKHNEDIDVSLSHGDDASLPYDDDFLSCNDEEASYPDDELVSSLEVQNPFEAKCMNNHVDVVSTQIDGPSDYVSFTPAQKSVTSLMVLLDSMECPDYAFEKIMRWART